MEICGRQGLDDLRGKLDWPVSFSRWTCLLSRVSRAKALPGATSIEGDLATVQDALAAVNSEDPLDASSDTWRAIVGYRNAMAEVRQLGRLAAAALILAETRTKPSSTSDQVTHPKGARRANRRRAGTCGRG